VAALAAVLYDNSIFFRQEMGKACTENDEDRSMPSMILVPFIVDPSRETNRYCVAEQTVIHVSFETQ
jgi:hypothetical protein